MSPQERRRQLLQERGELAVDTEEMEAPEFDQKQERLNQIITGVGAAASLLGALGGSEIAARAGQGLAQGGAGNLERQRQRFRQRRQSFRKRVQQAKEFNRQLALSTNEARVRGAETAAEREFQEEQAEEQREFQRGQAEREREFQRGQQDDQQKARRQLVKLRNRLEEEGEQMTGLERKQAEAQLNLVRQKVAAQEALTLERMAQAATAGGRGGGFGGDSNPYSHLSDKQVKRLLDRSNFMLETGFPAQADVNQDNQIDQEERAQATVPGSAVDLPGTADTDRVAERVSQLRAEAKRRGLIGSEGGQNGRTATDSTETTAPPDSTGAPRDSTQGRPGSNADIPTNGQPAPRDTTGAGLQTPSPEALGAPDSTEMERARDLVEEGRMSPAEFEAIYGESP